MTCSSKPAWGGPGATSFHQDFGFTSSQGGADAAGLRVGEGTSDLSSFPAPCWPRDVVLVMAPSLLLSRSLAESRRLHARCLSASTH